MNKSFKNIFPVILTLFLSFSLSAQDVFDSSSSQNLKDFGSGSAVDTKQIKPAVDNAPSADIIHFWDNLKDKTFDNLCRAAKIRLNRDGRFASDVIGVEGGFNRELEQYPNKRIALIDEVRLKLDATFGKDILNIPDIGPLNVGISGGLEGASIVVRPLDSDKYCKELDTLIDLREVKTIVPINAKRIAAMKVGEIWKVPLITRFSFSGGVGANPVPYITISIGGGITKERKPSVTLYRMDENTLRLRIRLERLIVKSVNAGVSSTFELEAGDIGLFQAENILTKEINRQIAREINKYIAFKLAYSHIRSSGEKILIEFLINPNVPEQLDALVDFLKGDLGLIKRFIELGFKFNHFSEDDDAITGLENIEAAVNATENAVGVNANFAGTDIHHGHSDNFNIVIPVIHSHQNSKNTAYNRYQTLNGDQVMHVYQAGKTSNGSTLNIPFIGTLSKYNSEKQVYAINKENLNNEISDPYLLFQHNVGFLRKDENTARDIINNVNGVLKYISMHGNGVDESSVLPVSEIFTESAQEENAFDENGFHNNAKTYKAAVVSFKLMISEQGIKEIILAPFKEILNAYLNVMKETERALVEKVAHLFSVDDKGVVDFDKEKAAQILNSDEMESGYNPLYILRDMAKTATAIIKDILSIGSQSDPKAQSQKLSEVAAGRGKSGLGFEDFLKVVVQLVSKENISAQVYVATDKRVKGEKDINQNYVITGSTQAENAMNEMMQMRDRFSDPSKLSD